jgi:glycosyltransferase involved in cell wall biosynthesis
LRNVNRNARLWLIGNDRVDSRLSRRAERLRGRLRSGDRIHFTGKPTMPSSSRSPIGELFLCASEHEGFCMPIAQAMAFDVPVMRVCRGRGPGRRGRGRPPRPRWDEPRVAELMHLA